MEDFIILVILAPLFLLISFFYASSGLGGATSYLAVLSLTPFSYKFIPSTALALNIVVSSLGFIFFSKKGFFKFKIAVPYLISSVPASFFGGTMMFGKITFSIILGLCLLIAGGIMVSIKEKIGRVEKVSLKKTFLIGVPAGAVLGFVAGIVGFGGGVLLQPALLFFKIANPKEAASVSSLFILFNSISGLIAHLIHGRFDIALVLPLSIVVLIGGFFGARFGAQKASMFLIQRISGLIIFIAGAICLIRLI